MAATAMRTNCLSISALHRPPQMHGYVPWQASL
jgi:hypothetical protein